MDAVVIKMGRFQHATTHLAKNIGRLSLSVADACRAERWS